MVAFAGLLFGSSGGSRHFVAGSVAGRRRVTGRERETTACTFFDGQRRRKRKNMLLLRYKKQRMAEDWEEDDVVYLTVEGMTRGVSLRGAYILLLRERGGRRHVPLLIDRAGAELLRRVDAGERSEGLSLALQMTAAFGLLPVNVSIGWIHGHRYSAVVRLGCEDLGYREVETDLADGIALAMLADCPIRMLRKVFETQLGRQRGDGMVALPISAMSRELLDEALKSAVAEENFELASLIRDEIKSRE